MEFTKGRQEMLIVTSYSSDEDKESSNKSSNQDLYSNYDDNT